MRLIGWMGASGRRFAVVWGLVGLAALAIGVGACSEPRSLVQLELDTSQLTVEMSDAHLHIDVTQDGHNVRPPIDKPLAELQPESANERQFQVGIFVPPSVSGRVQVVVIILDGKDCILGSSGLIPIEIDAGKASKQEKIVLLLIERQCPADGGSSATITDAGPEAQPPASDAGQPNPTDGPEETSPPATDAATSDTGCPPDVGVEAAPPPTCQEFCGMATTKCPAFYPSLDGCMTTCQPWRPGAVPDNASSAGLGEDTIGCRLYFLLHWTPNMAESFCEAVAPISTRCAH